MALKESTLKSPGLTELFMLYLVLGWRNLWRHPRRSMLTFLAIILGLMLFILTRALQLGTYEKIIEKAVRTHTGYIQIHAAGYLDNEGLEHSIPSTEGIFHILEKEAEVASFTTRIRSEALVASDTGTTGASVMGVDLDREFHVTTLSEKVKAGAVPEKGGDIMVGEGMAKNLGLSLGDTLILVANGADGSLGADRFTLSGIFRTGVADFDRAVVIMGLADADLLFSMKGSLSEVVVHLKEFERAQETALRLENALAGEGVTVRSWKALLPEMVQTITLDNIGGLIMLWFFFLIVVAVILNTILISTLERVREFGIMMSLGLKSSRIFCIITFEAALLAMVGTIIGLGLAWGVGSYLEAHPFGLGESMSRMQEEMGFSPLIYTKMSASLLFSWGGALFFASLLVALYPALKVARLSPLKAIYPGRGEL